MTACLQTDATSMPVTSRQAANGKAERKKSTKTFHTQLDPRWPDLNGLETKISRMFLDFLHLGHEFFVISGHGT